MSAAPLRLAAIEDGVVAVARPKAIDITTATTLQQVVAGAAIDEILALASGERVVTAEPLDGRRRIARADNVIPARSREGLGEHCREIPLGPVSEPDPLYPPLTVNQCVKHDDLVAGADGARRRLALRALPALHLDARPRLRAEGGDGARRAPRRARGADPRDRTRAALRDCHGGDRRFIGGALARRHAHRVYRQSESPTGVVGPSARRAGQSRVTRHRGGELAVLVA